MAQLEHANITVGDAHKTAAWLGRVFGWHIRWEGSALSGAGLTVHVGSEDSYLALFQPNATLPGARPDHSTLGQLNHVGFVVDDLPAVKRAIEAEGYHAFNHEKYEPGERFYFYDENHVEYEIVTYDA